MGLTTRGRRLTTRELLARHALGFGVLVMAMGAAYAGSRVQLAESMEPDVDMAAADSVSNRVEVDPAEINAHIVEVATRYGVEPRLVAAIVAVESEFNVHAVSRRGAQGLMQLMPETAADLDVRDSFDPRDNIDGGVRHFKRLMARFRNNLPLALAAYNAGEQAVINHRGIPPYRETRQYVIRVLRRYDRDLARAVALQMTQATAAASRPKVTPASYAGRAEVVPLAPAAAHAEVAEPAPPATQKLESP